MPYQDKTGMDEQAEKVFKGLECCLPETQEQAELSCAACPYDPCGVSVSLPISLIDDVRKLITAQQERIKELDAARTARVMTADEIVLSAEPSGWLCLEMKNGHCGEAYKTGRTISGFINFGHGFDSSFTSLFPEDYGKTWRCWTQRPTDEQRKAVRWE